MLGHPSTQLEIIHNLKGGWQVAPRQVAQLLSLVLCYCPPSLNTISLTHHIHIFVPLSAKGALLPGKPEWVGDAVAQAPATGVMIGWRGGGMDRSTR